MAWYDDILRSAGTCPKREALQDSSPCAEILQLGLEPQFVDNLERQWVTAAGWGNPSATLYILGTTPKWHGPETAGPNYASPDTDRSEHAREFTLRLFPEFVASSSWRDLRVTTKWTIALVDEWFGTGADLARDVFVPEMMLCPQHSDPSPRRFRKAYHQCMNRHFFALAHGRGVPPTLVILGAGATRTFYQAIGCNGPEPTTRRAVVTRAPDDELVIPVIASLAPQAAMQSGLSRSRWLRSVMSARDALTGASYREQSEPADESTHEISGRPLDTKSESAEFMPEELLGLRNRYGRRWAVAQAFVHGGTPDEILERAREYDRRRATELGRREASNIDGDLKFLRDEAGWYPAHFRRMGWSVRRVGERWVVERPNER